MAGGATLPLLGFDPGLSGAATLLGGSGVDAVWAWRTRQRGGERCFQLAVASRTVDFVAVSTFHPTLSEVGTRVARQVVRSTGFSRFPVWCEAVHIGRNAKTSIQTSWYSGALVGPAQKFALGREVSHVQASVWRNRLLGLPIRAKREVAKDASLRFIPPRLPGMADALSSLAGALELSEDDLDHVTDSGGVAEFGRRFPNG